jgi:hypothetical protein
MVAINQKSIETFRRLQSVELKDLLVVGLDDRKSIHIAIPSKDHGGRRLNSHKNEHFRDECHTSDCVGPKKPSPFIYFIYCGSRA